MSLKSYSIESLGRTLEIFLESNCQETVMELTQAVWDSPKRSEEFELNDFVLPRLTLDEKIILFTLSYWMPEEIRFILQLKIEEDWGGDLIEVLRILRLSKEHTLAYLIVSDRWNERDFFGNFLKKDRIKRLISRVRLRRRSTRVRKPQRRRGYSDKGSRRPEHISVIYDFRKFRSLEEQLALEIEREMKFTNLLRLVEEVS